MNSDKRVDTTGFMMKPQNFSVNDGEGIRTVLFLAGCPLRCKWCSNPEGLTVSEKEGFVCEYSLDEVHKLIEKQKIFYRKSGGGVTFSGGEATLQIGFLRQLVNQLYDEGVHLAIETSGHFVYEELKDVLRKMDQIFVDIKHMSNESHRHYTGKGNELILKNIEKMAELTGEVIVRIPVIEGGNSTDENIRETADFVKRIFKKPKIELLPYHELGRYKYEQLGLFYDVEGLSTPSPEKMNHLKEIVREVGVEIISYL